MNVFTYLVSILCLVFMIGCGGRALTYRAECCSKITPAKSTSSRITKIEIIDKRQNKSIDKSLSNDLEDTALAWLSRDLDSTHIFANVSTSRIYEKSHDKQIEEVFAELTIRRLEWEVPGYRQKMVERVMGVDQYGSGETDVFGKADLSLRLVKASDSTVLWSGSAKSEFKTRKATNFCDTHKTKAEVTGNALQMALSNLCQDLCKAYRNNDSGHTETTVPSQLLPLTIVLTNGQTGEGYLEYYTVNHLCYRKTIYGTSIKIPANLIKHCIVNADTLLPGK